MQRSIGLRRVAIGVGIGALSASAGVLGMMPAGASPVTHTTKSAVVVKIAKSRGGFKDVLTTTTGVGATLYTASSCTGGCLSVWPPLYMPKGKTVPLGPKGLTGLGTIKVGSHLQVTYKKHKLYTFVSDSGSSVTGNGVGGFKVIDNV
jgi:predicted lipoprotein with Yx(FWY)xxD motif